MKEQISEAAASSKPGGSNAGTYRTQGPYCGPAGGSAAKSYPVNSKKRAVAALAYARNAPNPSGIKRCVCRNWPSLPACKKSKDSEDQAVVNFVAHLDELKAMYTEGVLSRDSILSEIATISTVLALSDADIATIVAHILVGDDIESAMEALKAALSEKK